MVTPVNDALVLSDVSDQAATEESAFSASVSWTDIDGAGTDAYSVALDGDADAWLDPSDVTHDTESGVYSVSVSGTPDDENLNQNDLSVTVTDNSEGDPISLSAYLSVDVAPVNDPPTVSGYASAEVNEDESFTALISDFTISDCISFVTSWATPIIKILARYKEAPFAAKANITAKGIINNNLGSCSIKIFFIAGSSK